MALLGNDLTVRGYQLFEITKDPQRLDGQTLRHRGLGFGALKQVIANTFKLDEIVDAYRFMESNVERCDERRDCAKLRVVFNFP